MARTLEQQLQDKKRLKKGLQQNLKRNPRHTQNLQVMIKKFDNEIQALKQKLATKQKKQQQVQVIQVQVQKPKQKKQQVQVVQIKPKKKTFLDFFVKKK